MKKFIKSQTALQVVACAVIATFVIAGVVSAASTIGANITTAGTLEVTGASTLTGAVTTGAAATVGTDLTVTSGARVGTSSSGGHITALADDSLLIEGESEFDGTAWFDGSLRASSTLMVTGATTMYSTLTNSGLATFSGGLTSTATTTISGRIQGASPLKFDGVTANDANYLTLAVADPTGTNTITLPNGTGTVYITGGTDVTVADGGTGLSSYTAGDLIYASAATTLAKLASSTDATILMIDANGWPAWKAMSSDATISDAGVLTIASNAVAGTDIQLASEAAGDIMYSNGTDWVRLASSSDATILMTDANGWPAWKAMSGNATISDAGALTIANSTITAAKLATAAKTNTMAVRIADISTAEDLYVMMPKCTVTKISTVLSGAIITADSTVTAYQNTTAITDGVITIANAGSAAGIIDSATPSANNTFDGATQYLKLAGGGESGNVVPVIVTIEYTMTD